MRTEDHLLEYANFEGVIPQKEYGAGTVMVWDKGTWQPDSPDVDSALRRGDLKFTLHGEKLKGAWVLVRTPGYGSSNGRLSWLLIKHRDRYAANRDILIERPYSVLTHRLPAEIGRKGGGTWRRRPFVIRSLERSRALQNSLMQSPTELWRDFSGNRYHCRTQQTILELVAALQLTHYKLIRHKVGFNRCNRMVNPGIEVLA